MTDATRQSRHTLLHLMRIAYNESKLEFVKCLRLPAFSISLFVFPIGMFLFFGLGMNWEPTAVENTLYWATASSCMGVVGVGLFGFGVYVATERGQGWLLLKRVSPMPPIMYFLAKMAMSILFSAIVVVVIFGIALLFGNLDVRFDRLALLCCVLVLATIPFCTLGLAIAYVTGPNSAHAVVNLVYLPQLFLGGIVVPYQVLPGYLQSVATAMPSFHSVQLALRTIDIDVGMSTYFHIAVLTIYSAVFIAVAIFFYYRDEGKTFG